MTVTSRAGRAVQRQPEPALSCVGVTSGGISRGELEAAGATAVYEDVGALLDDLDQSPLMGGG